ncbi:hypothetical protein OQA88_11234 [Cercophora sp. LCS_1]
MAASLPIPPELFPETSAEVILRNKDLLWSCLVQLGNGDMGKIRRVYGLYKTEIYTDLSKVGRTPQFVSQKFVDMFVWKSIVRASGAMTPRGWSTELRATGEESKLPGTPKSEPYRVWYEANCKAGPSAAGTQEQPPRNEPTAGTNAATGSTGIQGLSLGPGSTGKQPAAATRKEASQPTGQLGQPTGPGPRPTPGPPTTGGDATGNAASFASTAAHNQPSGTGWKTVGGGLKNSRHASASPQAKKPHPGPSRTKADQAAIEAFGKYTLPEYCMGVDLRKQAWNQVLPSFGSNLPGSGAFEIPIDDLTRAYKKCLEENWDEGQNSYLRVLSSVYEVTAWFEGIDTPSGLKLVLGYLAKGTPWKGRSLMLAKAWMNAVEFFHEDMPTEISHGSLVVSKRYTRQDTVIKRWNGKVQQLAWWVVTSGTPPQAPSAHRRTRPGDSAPSGASLSGSAPGAGKSSRSAPSGATLSGSARSQDLFSKESRDSVAGQWAATAAETIDDGKLPLVQALYSSDDLDGARFLVGEVLTREVMSTKDIKTGEMLPPRKTMQQAIDAAQSAVASCRKSNLKLAFLDGVNLTVQWWLDVPFSSDPAVVRESYRYREEKESGAAVRKWEEIVDDGTERMMWKRRRRGSFR